MNGCRLLWHKFIEVRIRQEDIMNFFNYEFRNFNLRLLFYVILLNSIGVLIINSASNQDMNMVSRQIIGICGGLFIALVFALFNYHRLTSLGVYIYIICIISLIAVSIFGRTVNNATRWIVLPVVGQIQPSEFVKIGIIIFFSWYFTTYHHVINHVVTVFVSLALFGLPFFLIFSQPDLSTGLVVTFIYLSMIYVAGISYKWVGGVLGVTLPLGAIFIYLLKQNLVPLLKPYQVNRILAFVDREQYAEMNLQQDNSIMAIASGMLNGKGLNNNTLASVKNGNFLSEEQTDFIFAVIGEELGFVGSIGIIILIGCVVFECILMAGQAMDLSGRLICTGMAALIAFQSFANIAVATGVFPNTGLPLPLVSSGVSSLISTYIGIGICLNVGLQKKTKVH